MTRIIDGKSFFCSWSGGKDSCLALYHAMQQGGKPACLLTVLREDGKKSHSHGLPVSLLQRQSKALRVPLITCNASWEDYTTAFTDMLFRFKEQGIEYGIFGDIDIDDHLQWCRQVCSTAGMTACHPLWQVDRGALLSEFLRLGFSAQIIAVKQEILGFEFLGKQLSPDIILQMKNSGIDPCGEYGEYHTIVTGGPIFSSPIDLTIRKTEFHDGYYFLNIL